MKQAILLFLTMFTVNSVATAQTLDWAKSMGGAQWDIGYALAVDGFGNVFTTGRFSGTVDFDPNGGNTDLASGGETDIFIQKLDAAGNLLWAKSMGGIDSDIGRSIAISGSGDVYVTGEFGGTVDFDPDAGTSNLTAVGSKDIFVQNWVQKAMWE